MADWKRRLCLKPEWQQMQDGEMSSCDLARTIAARLRCLKPFGDDFLDADRDMLADEFLGYAECEEEDIPYFDDLMHQLYDWADTPLDSKWNGAKACWVETNF